MVLVLGSVLASSGSSSVWSQAFDCVVLNDNNTNIFLVPDECATNPEHSNWCNCASSLFTNPLKGQKSGFNQAVQWITDQPGTGNHRVEVPGGTLDLSGVTVGQVIGGTFLNELIPQSVGVPANTFFKLVTKIVVTAVRADSVDFDIVIIEVSAAAKQILRYDPLNACHSNGVEYRGVLSSLGPDNGFVVEYRYPRELIIPDPACTVPLHGAPFKHPGIDPGDADAPGFTVRYVISFFTEASGIYTLPNTQNIGVSTTLRRFSFRGETDPSLDEILELGAEDLCLVRDVPEADQNPCKTSDESLRLKTTADENNPPTARIVMVDPNVAVELVPPAEVQKACGEARIIFRGTNSDDGDGGSQTLTYEWFVASGPVDGATIPADTVNFKDTEVSFKTPGAYTIGLRVDDGGAVFNTDEVAVAVNVIEDPFGNIAPTAEIKTVPEPAEVQLAGGMGSIQLDGLSSSNGALGLDDCMQSLTFLWRQVAGPAAVIVMPNAAQTEVTFTLAGDYTFELEVDDGQELDNTAVAEVDVLVLEEPLSNFKRGDSDGNGVVEITDAIRTLNWLFTGGAQPPCLDAADSDDTGQIDISDAVRGLGYLFLGGAPPLPPGPDSCGPDVADDELAECVYDKC